MTFTSGTYVYFMCLQHSCKVHLDAYDVIGEKICNTYSLRLMGFVVICIREGDETRHR